MSPFTTTLIEWGSTLLSIYGFWLCIRHRSICFVVFLVANLGWFASAWMNAHTSLLAQQSVYILLNIVGYVMWRKDERLREELDRIEARELEAAPVEEDDLNFKPRYLMPGGTRSRASADDREVVPPK